MVTVTANRREQLRRDGITDIRLLQSAIPGLNIANQKGNIEIYIRSVGSSNNTELGDPGAAPHFNGNDIARPRGLGLMFYDLDQHHQRQAPAGPVQRRRAGRREQAQRPPRHLRCHRLP